MTQAGAQPETPPAPTAHGAEVRLIDRERVALREALATIAATRDAERRTESAYTTERDAARLERESAVRSAEEQAGLDERSAAEAFERAVTGAESACAKGVDAARARAAAAIRALLDRATHSRDAAEREAADAKWLAATVQDTDSTQCKRARADRERELAALRARRASIKAEADAELAARRLAPRAPARPPDDALTAAAALDAAASLLLRMRLRPGLTASAWVATGAIGAAILGGVGGAALSGWRVTPWATGLGVAVGLGVGVALWRVCVAARGRLIDAHAAVAGLLEAADAAIALLKAAADAEFQHRSREVAGRIASETASAQRRLDAGIASLDAEIHKGQERISREERESIAALEARRNEEIGRAATTRDAALSRAREARDAAVRSAETRLASRIEAADRARAASWNAIERRWSDGLAVWRRRCAEFTNTVGAATTDWSEVTAGRWTPVDAVEALARLGTLSVDLSRAPGGLPADPRVSLDEPRSFELPVALEAPDRASLLLEAGPDERASGVALLKLATARLLASLAPGKATFLFIDPVGLGQTFAGFMHLADADPALIGARAWTEPHDIEQRLGDVAERLEAVIQKCLRNEYASIEAYNAQAGELAEPYRFVVIADFPAGFTDTSARRLRAIIESGARCGVHTLILADPGRPAPEPLSLATVAAHSLALRANRERWAWCDPDFEGWPITLDPPPTEESLTALMRIVGPAAKAAKHVRTPFESIAPAPGLLWRDATARAVRAPLGRCGADRLQEFALGEGTAQHALIAGRTGSGKSTLLHVLVTSAAMRHSPDELEFYLVDFKKGVEFRVYAEHALPHARVIAIESDREFGLSVLQRLDAELQERGKTFRALGVQDIAGARRAAPDARLPRILLVVDEFQEFFTEDDAVAHGASLLLDRLVRQGRAFGVHVVLGSQTLGGAYNLGRSAMGQMAVRIALQCSEADAALVLSEENAAARLLSRPGEAIYNDASGAVEGNSPFQVAWLSPETHERALASIAAKAAEAGAPAPGCVVFEGAAFADITKCAAFTRDEPPSAETPSAGARDVSIWLGEPLAIKAPTSALLRRRSGGNLAIIGANPEAASALLAAAAASVVAAARRTGAAHRVVTLDADDAPGPLAGLGGERSALLNRAAGAHAVEAAVRQAYEEFAHRRESDRRDAPTLALIAGALHRLRSLRSKADEFGFVREGADDDAASMFRTMLKEGPEYGVHCVICVDSLASLQRAFGRQALQDFGQRTLLHMSAADSTTIMDAPDASRLGPWRAILCDEETARLEKFRPFAAPPTEWLRAVLGER